EVAAPPMDGVDAEGRRPPGVGEVVGVGDHQLLEVDLVGDDQEVDEKEDDQGEVDWSMDERTHGCGVSLAANVDHPGGGSSNDRRRFDGVRGLASLQTGSPRLDARSLEVAAGRSLEP